MMEALIDELISYDIRVELVGDDHLKISTGTKQIPAQLLEEIRSRKADLVSYLSRRSAADVFESIPQVALSAAYDISASQRRLWILSQFRETNVAYNIPGTHQFEGALNRPALEHAYRKVIERHESLRTVFRQDEKGAVKQHILSAAAPGFKIAFHDLGEDPEWESTVKALVQKEYDRPFDLSEGPLIRAALFLAAGGKWIFTYVVHHIISDGWSLGIFSRELMQYYAAFNKDEKDPLPPLRIQYKDYAAWLRQQLDEGAFSGHKAYWLKQFEGELPVLQLPHHKTRPAVRAFNAGAVVQKTIGLQLNQAMSAFCRDSEATLFMGMLAVVNALFCQYTQQEDIIIGTPVAGREHIDLEDQIGFYVNTIALRTRFSRENSFRELLQQVKQVTLDAYKHQAYPFDELVDALELQRDESRNPLFDVQVIVQNADNKGNNGQAKPVVHKYTGASNNGSVFDMVMNFRETDEGLLMNIVYNSHIYEEREVLQLAAHLEQMTTAVLAFPGKPISRLDFLSAQEKHQLLTAFNNTTVEYAGNKTIIDLFTEQVNRTPDQAAVVFAGRELTYRQLDHLSAKLAACLLKDYNVHTGDYIGVMMERSELMIIALLGIMKAGGVYVPVNPELPAARIAYILKDTGISVLITQAAFILGLDHFNGSIYAMDVQFNTKEEEIVLPAVSLQPQDLAYVIYTSGSTGTPKGVLHEQGALAASIQSQRPVFNIREGDHCMQFCSLSFDVSVFEIFIALTSGGILHIAGEETKSDPLLLEHFIASNNIAVASIPPAYLKLLRVDEIRSLKKLITGGEAAVPDIVNAFSETGTYYNAYGPTEAGLCAAVYEIDGKIKITNGNVPVGRPLPGMWVYIADGDLNLAPVGVAGEIYIGGKSLARGYLNDPALTAEKFIPDPFKEGGRLYRSGDTGCWLPDGNIRFAGRQDDQVKIGGHRVEPGETAKTLLLHEAVEDVVVMARPDKNGMMELLAYVVLNGEADAVMLRTFLSSRLPFYMIPHHFVVLPAFPLTHNGKVDRKSLPEPDRTQEVRYAAPENEIERKMAAIWEEVLGKTQIGVTDDYFELGGSSLKAMIVIKRVADEMNISLPIKILFEQKTIRGVAAFLQTTDLTPVTSIDKTLIKDHAAANHASYNQLAFFSGWNNQGDHLVVLNQEFSTLNLHALEEALNKLLERHEMLRTVFFSTADTILQRVLPSAELNIKLEPPVTVNADEMADIMERARATDFSLDTAPLFQIGVYQMDNGPYQLVFVMHHIITDGYSTGILRSELQQLYTGILQGQTVPAKPLPFQYRDFAAWQHAFVNSEEGRRHQQYWLHKLEGCKPGICFLPFATDDIAGKQHINVFTTFISGGLLEKLDRFTKEFGLTRPVLLMGVLRIVLNRFSGQQDLTLVTTVSGRNSRFYGELDVTGLIGFFANLVLLRHCMDKNLSLPAYLEKLQHDFLEDLAFDAYPFSKLVKELSGAAPEEFLRSAVFFNYHNYDYNRDTVKISDQDMEEAVRGAPDMKPALVLAVTEFKNCLQLKFLFNPGMLPYAEKRAVKDHYYAVLQQALDNSLHSL